MCNPRRINERASRMIAAAWEQSVSYLAQLMLQASATASITIPFGATFSPPVRRAFERTLATDGRWHAVDGGFETTVEDGRVIYRSTDGSLEISIRIEDIVHISEQRDHLVRVEDRREISATGAGSWDPVDRLGSEQEARAIAIANANRSLDAIERQASAALDQEIAARGQTEADRAEQRVREEAEAAARAAGEAQVTQRERELRAFAQGRLAVVRQQSTEVAGAALARAYQDVLVSFARQRGAQNLQTFSDDQGRLHIRFEAEG
jgi:hypothetical protein